MPKLSIYLSGRWKQSWRMTLDKDVHTNLTLSSAMSSHWTTSQPQRAGSNCWCCRKERAIFCLGCSMVEEDSIYRSLPEGEERFGALVQIRTNPQYISFKCDLCFSVAQSESELLISASQLNTWDEGGDPKFTKHQRSGLAFGYNKIHVTCIYKE